MLIIIIPKLPTLEIVMLHSQSDHEVRWFNPSELILFFKLPTYYLI